MLQWWKRRNCVLHSSNRRHLRDGPTVTILGEFTGISKTTVWPSWNPGTSSLPIAKEVEGLWERVVTGRGDSRHALGADCHALVWLTFGRYLDFSSIFYFRCLFDDVLMLLVSIGDFFYRNYIIWLLCSLVIKMLSCVEMLIQIGTNVSSYIDDIHAEF